MLLASRVLNKTVFAERTPPPCPPSHSAPSSVDVIMGLYMSYFLSDQYFLRADGVMPNRWGARAVRFFEGHDVTQKGLSERATSMASLGGAGGSFGNLDLERVGSYGEMMGVTGGGVKSPFHEGDRGGMESSGEGGGVEIPKLNREISGPAF